MSFLSKTFGGLSRSYYIRQFLFGLIFLSFFIFIGYEHHSTTGNYSLLATNIIYGSVCLFLYPYSRFVYESIIEYIVGNNGFLVNGVLFLTAKFITMFICFFLAIFIAPIGLIYLYFYHSKQEKLQNLPDNE